MKRVIHSRPPSPPSAEASGCWGGPGPHFQALHSPSASAPFLLVPGCFPGEELRPRAHESHSVLGSAGPWLPPQLLSGKVLPGHLLSALKGPPGRGGTRRVLWGGREKRGPTPPFCVWGRSQGPVLDYIVIWGPTLSQGIGGLGPPSPQHWLLSGQQLGPLLFPSLPAMTPLSMSAQTRVWPCLPPAPSPPATPTCTMLWPSGMSSGTLAS